MLYRYDFLYSIYECVPIKYLLASKSFLYKKYFCIIEYSQKAPRFTQWFYLFVAWINIPPPPKKKTNTIMSKINLDFLLHFMQICQNKAYFLHKSTRETLGLNKIKRIANINV